MLLLLFNIYWLSCLCAASAIPVHCWLSAVLWSDARGNQGAAKNLVSQGEERFFVFTFPSAGGEEEKGARAGAVVSTIASVFISEVECLFCFFVVFSFLLLWWSTAVTNTQNPHFKPVLGSHLVLLFWRATRCLRWDRPNSLRHSGRPRVQPCCQEAFRDLRCAMGSSR